MGQRQSRDQTLAVVPPAEPAPAAKASISRHYRRHGSERCVPQNPHHIHISKRAIVCTIVVDKGWNARSIPPARVGRTLLVRRL